jgi:hypothetical protein
VLRRAHLQGAMRLFGQIADGDGGHDGVSREAISMISI